MKLVDMKLTEEMEKSLASTIESSAPLVPGLLKLLETGVEPSGARPLRRLRPRQVMGHWNKSTPVHRPSIEATPLSGVALLALLTPYGPTGVTRR